jgi:hypothetical protein
MPPTLTGTGGTRREQMLQLAVDAYARGHTIPLGGNFRASNTRHLTAPQVEITLVHQELGKPFIVCGFSKMGDGSVCG